MNEEQTAATKTQGAVEMTGMRESHDAAALQDVPAQIRSAPSAAPSRTAVAWITVTLLAVPAAYVMLARPATATSQHAAQRAAQSATPHASQPGTPVMATVPPPPAAQVDLAQLEAQTRSNPTEANRLNLSQAYIDRGMNARAIGVLNALVADYPRNALGWNNLCFAHTLQQEYNLAIPACEAGIRADGSVALLHNNLKWAQEERAKVLAAIAEEDKVAIANRDAAFYLNQGMNQLHLGAYEEAVAAWKRCLQLDPRNGNAQNNIGVALMLQSQPVKAEGSFREALAVDPNNPLFHNNLSWAISEAAAAR